MTYLEVLSLPSISVTKESFTYRGVKTRNMIFVTGFLSG